LHALGRAACITAQQLQARMQESNLRIIRYDTLRAVGPAPRLREPPVIGGSRDPFE
jgi:hypothetical protein